MTERNTTTEREGPATLGELSHTNPYTGESFGDAMVFDRGPVVAADGGEPEAEDPADDEANEEDRLKDVDHTPPVGDGANRVHERGGEHPDEEPV